MIVLDCEQRDEVWKAARMGIPTSSQFSRIMTPTGKPSDQAKTYLAELIAEKKTGHPTYHFVGYEMRKGIELEDYARLQYELIRNVDVLQIGFCFMNEKRAFGASTDGLVNDDGILELKYARPDILANRLQYGWKDVNKHNPQNYGGLLITGRKWCDLMCYTDPPAPGYEGLDPIIIRYERNPDFIATLHIELNSFCEELDRVTKELGG